MARISRAQMDALYYHVMVQGIGKEYIFDEKCLKAKYKELILKKSKILGIHVVAYCIMDNHVHLLFKVEYNDMLSKLMSQVNTSYGKFYNKHKKRVGYVFRDRYRAEPIYNKNHLQNCIRYIHENPVKAKIVSKCEDYSFSSFNDYKNYSVDKNIIEDVFGKNEKYIEIIDGDYEDYHFIEINNEFGEKTNEDFKVISNEYNKIDFSNKDNVYKYSKEIKRRCHITNTEIMQFMGIKKTTYYSIMKRMKTWTFDGRPQVHTLV